MYKRYLEALKNREKDASNSNAKSYVYEAKTNPVEGKKPTTEENQEDVLEDKSVAEMDPVVLSVCQGDMEHELPNQSKLVRIFTSSTFTDTKVERNALMEKVYPKLKALCQTFGYEFQVVDMRWGVRDEAVDDHRSTELCLRELELCKKLSTGPSFVTFLSHKYGYRPIPRVIAATEFEEILRRISDKSSQDLLNKWFRKDENCIPLSYVLQPISTHYPDFLNKEEPEKREKAKATFWSENEEIQALLCKAAQTFLQGKELEKYTIAVTESEIQMGLLEAKNVNDTCLWFKRTIVDIEEQDTTRMVSRFYECKGTSPEVVAEARNLLSVLKDQKIPEKISPDNIMEYSVNWHPDGIVPEELPQHNLYIKKLCSDFETRLGGMITKAVEAKEQSVVQDRLYLEIAQHLTFCKEKCEHFYGRNEIIEQIKDYVSDEKATTPLILHGASGSGKTSIMAKAAMELSKSMKGKACVVLRFLGTTQESSNIETLLHSVTQQIFRYLSKKIQAIPNEFKKLCDFFSESLSKLIPRTKQVIMLLDSIDQLEVDLGARQCQWLPALLGPRLRVIISTLPEEKYQVMPNLRSIVKDESSYISVTSLTEDSVSDILSSWCKGVNRNLTEKQFKIVIESFKKCPLPLYLKLAFDESCHWHSYTEVKIEDLRETVPTMIELLFTKLERDHGKVLTSRALGYLTLARSGLSEGELEDILSIDDTVLNDTYQFWVPPLRRLPPLLLARIRYDLSSYLVERGADRTRVLVWYHRQFIEAAKLRYCSDPEVNRELHGIMAEYFRGIWAETEKPYVDRRGNKGSALRYVTAQPLISRQQYNLRKLMELPHHLMRFGDVNLFKKECLCSFEFLLGKMTAKGVRSLINDVLAAKKFFPDDEEIKLFLEVLQLSQGALQYEPTTLAGQLLGRIYPDQPKGEFIQQLLNDSRTPPVRSFAANKPVLHQPGGQLVHVLTSHKKDILAMSISPSGKLVVTCSEDRSVKIWNIPDAVLIRTIEKVAKDMLEVRFVRGEEYVLAVHEGGFSVINAQTGAIERVIPSENGKEATKLVLLDDNVRFIGPGLHQIHIYDANTWEKMSVIDKVKYESDDDDDTKKYDYSPYSAACARNRYLVICPYLNDHYIDIYDLERKEFLKRHLAFPLPPTDDDDDICVAALVLTRDESQIIFNNDFNHDIFIYSFPAMEQLRTFPTSKSGRMEKFFLSPDEKFLYGVCTRAIGKINLETEKAEYVCSHTSTLTDIGIVSSKDIVTVATDNALRIWDLSRSANKILMDRILGVEYGWRGDTYTLGDDERYIVATSSVKMKTDAAKKEDKDHFAIMVYDLKSRQVISKTKFYMGDSFLSAQLIDSHRMLLDYDRKLSVFDLKTQEITHDLVGYTAKYTSCFEFNAERNEVWTPSRGAFRVKCYDLSTGKVKRVVAVPGTKASKPIDEVKLSPDGKLLFVTDEDCEHIIVLDTETDQVVADISYNKKSTFSLTELRFALKNTVITITVEAIVNKKTLTSVAVYDLIEKKWKHVLFDKLSYLRFMIQKKRGVIPADEDHNMEVYSYEIMNDELCVTGTMDCIVRVWNIRTGTLCRMFHGHTQDVSSLYIPKNPACKRFMSSSSMEGENAIRVWDLDSPNCVATFKMDVFPKDFHVIQACNLVIGFFRSSMDPAIFYQLDKSGFCARWSGSPIDWLENSDKEKKLEINVSKTYEREPDDLDSDVDPVSDEDTDMDDDDDLVGDDDADSDAD